MSESGMCVEARTPEQVSMIRLDQVQRMLAEEVRIDPIKDLVAKAEAARIYAKQRDLGLAAQNLAAEVRIRAERRLGELLLAGPKAKGTRGQLAGRDASGGSVRNPPEDEFVPSYRDLGISKRQAALGRWFARTPEGVFHTALLVCRTDGIELTVRSLRAAIRGVLRDAKDLAPEAAPPDPRVSALRLLRRARGLLLRAAESPAVPDLGRAQMATAVQLVESVIRSIETAVVLDGVAIEGEATVTGGGE